MAGPRPATGWSWGGVKRSAADRAFGVDVDGVERLARRHEQPVPLDPTEAQIGAALRQRDAADHLAVRGKHDAAVEAPPAAPPAPQIAVPPAAQPRRRAVAALA